MRKFLGILLVFCLGLVLFRLVPANVTKMPQFLIGALALAVIALIVLIYATCKHNRLKADFEEQINVIERSNENVASHMVDFLGLLDSFAVCLKMSGKTKALAEEAGEGLDQVLSRSKAAADRIAKCKAEASFETAFGWSHLDRAIEMISD